MVALHKRLGVLVATIAILLCGAAVAADGTAPRFLLPLDCDYGKTCFIQNYVDHDPGPGRADYECGRLTYDGHDGTDIRLRDEVAMWRGYRVLAAAPGVVVATRDGMEDVNMDDIGMAAIKGREAGNGVLIDHGNGWTTQYSHMRKGSVAVHRGEVVSAGQMLGLVGLSGKTEFPHLDFTVRHDGRVIDPFVGTGPGEPCGQPGSPMWLPDVARTLEYRPTDLLGAFFADAVPTPAAARRGAFRLGAEVQDPQELVLWVDVLGLLRGDTETYAIVGPNGRPVLEKSLSRDDSRVSWFSYAGVRRPGDGWAPGLYRGEYRLLRDGAVIAHADIQVEITR